MLAARDHVPHEYYKYFLESLLGTVRDGIAECSEVCTLRYTPCSESDAWVSCMCQFGLRVERFNRVMGTALKSALVLIRNIIFIAETQHGTLAFPACGAPALQCNVGRRRCHIVEVMCAYEGPDLMLVPRCQLLQLV